LPANREIIVADAREYLLFKKRLLNRYEGNIIREDITALKTSTVLYTPTISEKI
jgi:hypothetical protein